MNNSEKESDLSFEDTVVAFKHQTDNELKISYWLFKIINSNLAVNVGALLTNFALFVGFPVKGIIRKTIFKQFCGGESIAECLPVVHKLAVSNVGTILDYAVEGAQEEAIFDATANQIIKTIAQAKDKTLNIPFCVFKITGIGRFSLLEKANAKKEFSALDTYEWHKIEDRVDLICKTAFDANVKIMIDAEESWIQDAIDGLAISMMLKYNKEQAIVYNTYQLYRHDKLAGLTSDLILAKTQHFYLGVKLVRGAYMEKERKRALEKGYISPIQNNKADTDRDYNQALALCTKYAHEVAIVAGTHNELSCKLLVDLQKEYHISNNDERVYYAQLLGMSDNLSFNLAHAGFNVAKYVPFGPVKSVMPYLMRRAQENTAISGQSSRELVLYKKEMNRRGI